MVSLRSGKRTARRSAELQQEETPKTTTTPRRTTRSKKVIEKEKSPEKVVEEEKVEVVEDVSMTESSGEGPEDEVSQEPEEEIEEEKEIAEEPKEEASKEPEEEEESDDDDEPMEVTSKKEPSYDIKVADAPEPVVSVFEQVMAKKAAKSAKEDEKKLKKKSKREARKIAKGVFQVKMKKSKTSFKVVTLNRGVQQALEPANSFRDDLLLARTAKGRMHDSQMVVQRRDWVSKR